MIHLFDWIQVREGRWFEVSATSRKPLRLSKSLTSFIHGSMPLYPFMVRFPFETSKLLVLKRTYYCFSSLKILKYKGEQGSWLQHRQSRSKEISNSVNFDSASPFRNWKSSAYKRPVQFRPTWPGSAIGFRRDSYCTSCNTSIAEMTSQQSNRDILVTISFPFHPLTAVVAWECGALALRCTLRTRYEQLYLFRYSKSTITGKRGY